MGQTLENISLMVLNQEPVASPWDATMVGNDVNISKILPIWINRNYFFWVFCVQEARHLLLWCWTKSLGDPDVSPWDATMVGTQVKISKICLSGLVEITILEAFLCKKHVISAIFFVIKLVVFAFAYIMYNVVLVLKRQKSRLGVSCKVRRKLLEVLLAFNWFIFLDRKDKQTKMW